MLEKEEAADGTIVLARHGMAVVALQSTMAETTRSSASAAALLLIAAIAFGQPNSVWCWSPAARTYYSQRHWCRPADATHTLYATGVAEDQQGVHVSSSEAASGLVTSAVVEQDGSSNNNTSNGGNENDEGKEKVLWQDAQENGAQLCQICTSADGEIPMSALPPQIVDSSIRRRLDAIYHAASHQETGSLRFMKSQKQSSRQQLQGTDGAIEQLPLRTDSAGLSDLEERFDEEEERQLITIIRSSLEDAGFELLDRRDLDLCEALNAGYLLRLSIQPNLKQCDPKIAEQFYPERLGTEDEFLFDGRVLVFRRGYSEEETVGRLLLPKLDYLQASIVQRSARIVTSRLARFERWVVRKCSEISGLILAKTTDAVGKIPFIKSSWNTTETNALIDETNGSDERNETKVLKLSRYGGSREQFVAAPDLSEAINPFLVCDVTDTCTSNGSIYDAINTGEVTCEYDASYPQRKGDRERPMRLLRRVSISNLVDFFSPQGRRAIIRGYFEKAKLVEPTYEEVVVVWRPLPKKRPKVIKEVEPPKALIEVAEIFGFEDKLPGKLTKKQKPKKKADAVPSLKIRAFTDVPMANLPAVLPRTKLVFRPADAFVFDTVSLLSLAAVLASQRFDNPKFDLIAIVSVSLWVIRTAFRYSNKLARYDLLVNKFLKERISHRGANALKYLSSEAATQKATRAALLYSTLQEWFQSKPDRREILERGSKEVNKALRADRLINIDAETTLEDLETLGAICFIEDKNNDGPSGRSIVEDVLNEEDFSEKLKMRWNDILP